MYLIVILILALLALGPASLVLALLLRKRHRELARKVARLEAMLAERPGAPWRDAPAAELSRRTGTGAISDAHTRIDEPLAGEPPVGAMPPIPAAPSPKAPDRGISRGPDLETILGGQWLTWLGILAIFFGTAFFLAYDLRGHAVAGTGQILIGLLIAALFVAAGRLASRSLGIHAARGMLGGGVALLFLSAYAAYAFHRLVPATVVYPFLLVVSLIGAAVATLERSQMIATLTQVCALLVPLFLAGRGDPPGPLFAYLATLNLGSALLMARQRWPVLTLVAFAGTVTVVLWWWSRGDPLAVRGVAAAGVTVLWALFAVSSLGWRTGRASEAWGMARTFLLVANALLFELAVFHLLGRGLETIRGLFTALLSLVYVGVPWLMCPERERTALPAARATGLALGILAIPIQLDLEWVTLGWAFFAAVLLFGGSGPSGRVVERLLGWGVLAMSVFRVLLLDVIDATTRVSNRLPLLNGAFLVGLGTVAVVAWCAWLVTRRASWFSALEQRLVKPLILIAAALLLWRLSFECVTWFHARALVTGQDLGRPLLLALSLLWAIYAGLLILGGFLSSFRPIRILGMAVLVLLTVKVFAFDLKELERGLRIASFVGVGLALLLISLFYQRERRLR